jgi:hypothetical protein
MAGGERPTTIAGSPAVVGEEVLERVRCFLSGARLGDALEDLQEQTEDLVQEAATGAPTGTMPQDMVFTTWDVVKSELSFGRDVCGTYDDLVETYRAVIDHALGSPHHLTTKDVSVLRQTLDSLTARMAVREFEVTGN